MRLSGGQKQGGMRDDVAIGLGNQDMYATFQAVQTREEKKEKRGGTVK